MAQGRFRYGRASVGPFCLLGLLVCGFNCESGGPSAGGPHPEPPFQDDGQLEGMGTVGNRDPSGGEAPQGNVGGMSGGSGMSAAPEGPSTGVNAGTGAAAPENPSDWADDDAGVDDGGAE